MGVIRWGEDDGATVRAVRRVFSRTLVLMAAGILVLMAYEHSHVPFLIGPVGGIVPALLLVTVARALGEHVGILEVALLGAATLAAVIVATASGDPRPSSVTTLVSVFCIACVSMSRVKELAGFRWFEMSGRSGWPGRGAPPWAGSRPVLRGA